MAQPFVRSRLIATSLVLAFVALACGQKPGVHVAARGEGEAAAAAEGEAPSAEGVAEGAPAEGGEGAPAGGQAAPASGGGGAAAGGGGAAVDRTGVSDTTIVVGLHAPVTGAAPFRASSFEKGRDVYWEWAGAPTIYGRKVKLVFEDDAYNPFTAVDKCRKMAEQDKAFILIGGGGTDQIQACARWAASRGIPYLSAGVTEVGIRNLKNYFAFSMSYRAQAPLLVQMIKNRLGVATVAMVRTNTPNFQDAHDAFVGALGGAGLELIYDRAMSKNPSATEYDQVARELAAKNAQAVFVLVAPVHYVQLTAAHRLGTYRPWWVGVGITMGLNDVLSTGCRTSANAINQGLFFSPFPGLDAIDGMDPDYSRAYRERNQGQAPDDIGMALWGLNKSLHAVLGNVGQDLSRQSFVAATERASLRTGLFPDLRFSPQDHFGADSVHLLKANCSTQRYETAATFARSF